MIKNNCKNNFQLLFKQLTRNNYFSTNKSQAALTKPTSKLRLRPMYDKTYLLLVFITFFIKLL